MHEGQFSNTKFKNINYIASYTLVIGFLKSNYLFIFFYIFLYQKYVYYFKIDNLLRWHPSHLDKFQKNQYLIIRLLIPRPN